VNLRLGDDGPGQLAQATDSVAGVAAAGLGKPDFAALPVDDELVALVAVGELHRRRKANTHPVLQRPRRPRKVIDAAPAPVERGKVAGFAEQREDPLRAFCSGRPHVFRQSGRVGAAQRVSPDPPAEPYVQLSLDTALRCDNTIHVPGIGQASTV
jgi:hypothetical protein